MSALPAFTALRNSVRSALVAIRYAPSVSRVSAADGETVKAAIKRAAAKQLRSGRKTTAPVLNFMPKTENIKIPPNVTPEP